MKKTITIPGFIYARKPDETDYILKEKNVIDGVKYLFDSFQFSPKSEVFTKVCDFELKFDLPESFNPVESFIANLNAEKKKAMADFQARCTEIDRQISQLQAIEFTPKETT